MDEKTRKNALEKVDAIKSIIAYPDELLQESKLEQYHERLEITSDDYHENFKNLKKFNKLKELEKLTKPIDEIDWIDLGKKSISVSAGYEPDLNLMSKYFNFYYELK